MTILTVTYICLLFTYPLPLPPPSTFLYPWIPVSHTPLPSLLYACLARSNFHCLLAPLMVKQEENGVSTVWTRWRYNKWGEHVYLYSARRGRGGGDGEVAYIWISSSSYTMTGPGFVSKTSLRLKQYNRRQRYDSLWIHILPEVSFFFYTHYLVSDCCQFT